MNFTEKVVKTIAKTNSCVCVGLDIDTSKIPACLKNEKDPISKFNKEIIEATKDLVCAYKPNLAFYESYGIKGIESFEKSIKNIGSDILVIADAKRGDIGNTSKRYAKAFLEYFDCDAMTVSPYMGFDSVEPFLEREDKGVFVLAVTSNKGSKDFQFLQTDQGYLYEVVIKKLVDWNEKNNIGLVVGATHPQMHSSIREIAPEMPYLIPGIGKQGGDLENTVKNAFVKEKMLSIVNSSRAIIYASNGPDFAEKAREKAMELRDQINTFIDQFNLK